MSWIKTILADRMNYLTELNEEIRARCPTEVIEFWEINGGISKEDTDETILDLCMDEEEFNSIVKLALSCLNKQIYKKII